MHRLVDPKVVLTVAEEQADYILPILWVGLEDEPVLSANQFVSQFDIDGFVLTIGHIAPPLLLGSEEQRREQVSRLDYVPAQPLARVRLTPDRVRELIALLQDNLSKYEEAVRGASE